MNSWIWLLILAFAIAFVHGDTDNVCSNIVASDGSKYDLITLVEKGNITVPFVSKSNVQYTLTFSICASAVPCVNKKLVGACLLRSSDGAINNHGNFSPNDITALSDGQGVQLLYDNGNFNTQTTLVLLCDYNSVGVENYNVTLRNDTAGAIGDAIVTIRTESACPLNSPISGGTIFMIIVLGIAVMYLVIGILVNKFSLMKQGREVIPQSEFWCDLPSLVKTGAMFLFCRSRLKSYETVGNVA